MPPSSPRPAVVVGLSALAVVARPALAAAPAIAADEADEEISVVAPARLPRPPGRGDGLAVTTVDGDALRRSGARTLQDALRVAGLALADEQGNPFQQDLSMRGLVASPVTGLSQGVSVFVDGVRVNEPGVEEVNFDLLPLGDVERVEIIRGPHAIFGRNTLAGAIHLVTRRGGPVARGEVQVEGGSFGHQQLEARAAGPLGPLDAHLSLLGSSERGWRDAERSRALRVFAKVGILREGTDVGLSYQGQVDRLEQPGSLPLPMLAADRRANYTAGDFFRPELHLVTLNGRQALPGGLTVAANVHVRSLDAEQFNASWIAPDTRMLNRTRTVGGAALLEHVGRAGALRSQAVAGIEAGRSTVGIAVDEEPNARFPAGDPAEPLPARIGDLYDEQLALGAFAQGHLRVARGPLAGLGATAALRWDRIAHDVVDTSPPSPGGATGSGAYARWIPAAGLSWALGPRASVSASWSEGFRAPAFLELTCADPAAPCVGLQAGVAPDASFTRLRPVRARAFEAGASVAPQDGLAFTVAAFRIDLRDDIYGVVTPDATRVYFRNVGATRRQGVEATLRAEAGPGAVDVSYALTRATFESDLALATPRVAGGEQPVRAGNRLPLVPEHQLDVEGRVRALRWLELSAGVRWVGAQVLRGDEANVAPRLAPYGVVRAGVTARAGPWTASVRATNLLDARYETFGTFAVDGRSGAGIQPFLTPGAPLRVVLAVRWGIE